MSGRRIWRAWRDNLNEYGGSTYHILESNDGHTRICARLLYVMQISQCKMKGTKGSYMPLQSVLSWRYSMALRGGRYSSGKLYKSKLFVIAKMEEKTPIHFRKLVRHRALTVR